MDRNGEVNRPNDHAPAVRPRALSFTVERHPHRFSRALRLTANRQYQQVYRRGKSFHARHMTLFYLRAKEIRAGFSVSSKVGNSVTRNRLRRRMKEDFRLARPSLIAGKYIFVARRNAATADAKALQADFSALLRKAGALRSDADNRP